MPSLSISYDKAIGPITQVTLFHPDFDLTAPITAPIVPRFYAALIDTGASNTCITRKVIDDLQISPIEKRLVGGVHGQQATNIYNFQLGLAFQRGQPNASGVVSTNLISWFLEGSEFVSNSMFDVLLGRDVICQGVFSLSFDGHSIFSI